MFIGSIGFERTQFSGQYKSFGKLWYDHARHSCSLFLLGFRQGTAFCKPFESVAEPPYINGDINVFTHDYEDKGILRKHYQWCGFVYTESNQSGCIYQIMLEVDPTIIMSCSQIAKAQKAIRKDEEYLPKYGMFLSVHLTDKE